MKQRELGLGIEKDWVLGDEILFCIIPPELVLKVSVDIVIETRNIKQAVLEGFGSSYKILSCELIAML